MEISAGYLPSEIFGVPGRPELAPPRVFIAPQRYIQGEGVLDRIGAYLSLTRSKRAALLMTKRGQKSEGERVLASLRAASIEAVVSTFGGECSLEEIAAHVTRLETEKVDCLIAAGGGKCVDAGKAVAYRLGVPVVVAPSLASNDAPCSALSVLYSSEGVSTGVEFYPRSPALVIVDTGIVAAAPERYLVAGMGDAMATWYEARVCLLNPAARSAVGARPTLASAAIGETCARNLFESGHAAAAAVAAGTVDESLETVVEANTLLSGLGFESGGLAAAHSVAQSFTAIARVHADYLHGEMVAMGTLAQLMMESRMEEAEKVAVFFAGVGLPVHLAQISLDRADASAIETIVEGTLAFPFIGNMPMALGPEQIRKAVLDADRLGRSVAEKAGDEAYRRVQAG
jgi:glycerol dehydrogenase